MDRSTTSKGIENFYVCALATLAVRKQQTFRLQAPFGLPTAKVAKAQI